MKSETHVGGNSGPQSLAGFDNLRMGVELANGSIVLIIWFSKHRAYIVTQNTKAYKIYLYNSVAKYTRKFNGRTYFDNLKLMKIYRSNYYDINDIFIKIANQIKNK